VTCRTRLRRGATDTLTMSLRFAAAHPEQPASVLLVEDEPTLADVLARILSDEGYAVTVRGNGLDALDVVRCGTTRIDVIVSDVGLPGLRGDKLAAAVRRLRPTLPVVLMSGFSAVVTPGNEEALGVVAVLEKPVTIEDLLATVQDALRPGAARS
jgi:DNA-binding NtrC family response regulator